MKYTPPLNSDDPNASFINADPANGQEGSIIPAGALEFPQREIISTITAAGIEASEKDNSQLNKAIDKKISVAKQEAEESNNSLEQKIDKKIETAVKEVRLENQNDYVTTNTAQTITSQKTFESNIISAKQHFIDIRDDRIDALTNPASNISTGNYRFSDKNGKSLGFMHAQQTISGENKVILECRNYMGTPNDNSDYNHCMFSTVNNGTISYVAFSASSKLTNNSLLKPDSSTSQTIIPTMGWVNNPATSTNVLHRRGHETINGIKTFNESINANSTLTVKGATTLNGMSALGDVNLSISTSVTVPTISVDDATKKAINSEFINNKFKVVDSLPQTPNSNTFYYIKE